MTHLKDEERKWLYIHHTLHNRERKWMYYASIHIRAYVFHLPARRNCDAQILFWSNQPYHEVL